MPVPYVDPFGPPWRCGTVRLILQWKGSILQVMWMEMTIATICALVFMAVWLYQFLLYDERLNDILEKVFFFSYALNYITERFQAALGMMLGFYTTIMYNRWWRVRSLENNVMSGIKCCAINVSSYINTRTDKEQAVAGLTREEVISSLIRWVNLSHAIAIGQLYEKDNAFRHLDGLVDMGLMTEKELDCIQHSPAKYDLPLRWFVDLLDKIVRSDNFAIPSPPALSLINNAVTRTRTALDDLFMYRTEPVPLSYRQLVNMTVRFYVIILILNEGLSALSFSYDKGYYENARSVFSMALPFVFEYFLFVGWLTLSDALANPFRHWSDEFQWEDFVRRTYIASFSLMRDQMNSASKSGPLTSKDLKKAERTLSDRRRATLQMWKAELEAPEHDSCMMQCFGFDKRP